MKLIVGLGNPGERYAKTRHNVGFLVLDELKTEITNSQFSHLCQGYGGQAISNQPSNINFHLNKKYHSEVIKLDDLILAKPNTFMNKSGEAVSSLVTYYKLHATDIYVVHDDLDINLGEYKIQRGKGPREHRGLLSVYDKLGTKDFWHVRVGVENRKKVENGKGKKENNIPGEDYVLLEFDKDEMEVIDSTIKKAARDLITGLTK